MLCPGTVVAVAVKMRRRMGAVMTAFGEQMGRLMAERGVSLHRLARLVNYDVGYLCKVKNGHKRPSAALAVRVDEALGAGGVLIGLAPAVQPHRQGRGDVPAAGGAGARCAPGRQQGVGSGERPEPVTGGGTAVPLPCVPLPVLRFT